MPNFSEKLLIGLFVLNVSTAIVFSHLLAHRALAGKDGKPAFSTADIHCALVGNVRDSILSKKIRHRDTCRHTLTPDETRKIHGWLGEPHPEDHFHEIKPLLDAGCASCHGPAGNAAHVPLDTYYRIDNFMRFKPSIGHYGLVALTILILVIGSIVLCVSGQMFYRYFPHDNTRALIVVVPFVGLMIIFSGLWFVRYGGSAFAWVPLAGLLLADCGLGLQFAITLLGMRRQETHLDGCDE